MRGLVEQRVDHRADDRVAALHAAGGRDLGRMALDEVDILVAEGRPVEAIPGGLAALAAAYLQRQLARQAEGIEQRPDDLENAALPHELPRDPMLLVRRLLVDDAHLVGARLRLRARGMELERERHGNSG